MRQYAMAHRGAARLGGARATGQREAALLAADAGGGGSHSDALSVHPRAVSFLASPAGGFVAGRDDLGVDGIQLRPVQSTSDGQDILESDCREANGALPPPPRRGRDPAAQPRRTPASPQALLARASSRSYFDLAGKILVGSSCMANWMHSWLIGQILLMRRRHHAGFRAGDEFFQTTESPSKH